MNSDLKGALAFILFTLSLNSSNAQLRTSSVEVGVNVGTLIYQGDLVPSFLGNYRTLKPALGLFVGKALDPYFSLRANLTLGKIASDESEFTSPVWRQYRNFTFSSPVTELSANLIFNPLGDNIESSRRLSGYLFAGTGATFLNIKRDWSRVDTTFYPSKSDVQQGLAIDTLHTAPKVLPVFPIGAGIRYMITPGLSLHTEISYRFTSSDYLDGFKYAANPKNKDNYYGLTIGLSYRFENYKCPAVRK